MTLVKLGGSRQGSVRPFPLSELHLAVTHAGHLSPLGCASPSIQGLLGVLSTQF